MSQMTFAEADYAHKKRKTRREMFLERTETLIPWQKIERKLARHYPKGGIGRPPYPLATMLRVHCMQLFYNLADPAMEDALYEVESMRRFAHLHLDRIPDETTILNFRHFLERHGLGRVIFNTIAQHLDAHGLMLREGSIIDASLIAAPPSTKNAQGERDPDMHSVKKGNEWYFGMKIHIGVDDALGLIHSVETTSAEVHDLNMADTLLHGDEKRVWGDTGYTGIEKRQEHSERDADFLIARHRGKVRQLADSDPQKQAEQCKASVRAKVEHPFLWIKHIFGYRKVRYRGLAKNTNRLLVLAGLTNLMLARKYLAV